MVPIRPHEMVYRGLPKSWPCFTPKGLYFVSYVLCITHLLHQVFPDNEVKKGLLTMQLKRLRETQEQLQWPSDSNDLPIVTWDTCKSGS